MSMKFYASLPPLAGEVAAKPAKGVPNYLPFATYSHVLAETSKTNNEKRSH